MKKTAGVTLIELMTVMLIISVLAAIAVPSYQSYMTRTYRSAAKACLSEYVHYMERYYTTHFTYLGANATFTCPSDTGVSERYNFATPILTQRLYTVAATPIAVQAMRDAKCGVLTLDESGVRTVSGSAGRAACW
jgi:type IV pilus assembly protein PilE